MPSTEMIPVRCIWLAPDQMSIRPSSEMVEKLKNESVKQGELVVVNRSPKLPRGQYAILRGVATFLAAKMAGRKEVACAIEHGYSFFLELRQVEEPIEWAKMAQQLIESGYSMPRIVEESHLPRSVVLDRFRMLKSLKEKEARGIDTKRRLLRELTRFTEDPILFARKCKSIMDEFPEVTISQIAIDCEMGLNTVEDRLAMLEAVNQAEQHGKVLGRQEKVVEENERAILSRIKDIVLCKVCKREFPNKSLTDDGMCATCGWKTPEERKSPKERGLKLCLEPKCRTWITGKPSGILREIREKESFCKKHRKTSFEAFPLYDRDGDPIWVGAGFVVTKMHDMEMSHLLNCIMLLERAARKRAEITANGGPGHTDRIKAAEEKALAEMPRYPLLIAEVKQRDACKLCKGGLILSYPQTTEIDGEPCDDISKPGTVSYCTCDQGQQRKATDAIAEQSKGKDKATILILAMAFVTALLNAPALSPHVMEFLHGVHARLRAMGLL